VVVVDAILVVAGAVFPTVADGFGHLSFSSPGLLID